MLPRASHVLRRSTKHLSSSRHFKQSIPAVHNDTNVLVSHSRCLNHPWRTTSRAYGTGSTFSSSLLHLRPFWSTPRVIVAILVSGGVTATVYGLYQLYSALTMWPPELRDDLRAGLRAKHQGDLTLAAKYLYKAYEKALHIPLSRLGSEPYLKISGIAITLSEVYEAYGQYDEASNVLEDVFGNLTHALVPPSEHHGDTAEDSSPTVERAVAALEARARAKSSVDADLDNDETRIKEETEWMRQVALRFAEGKFTKDDITARDQIYSGHVLSGNYMTIRERLRMVAMALKIAELKDGLGQLSREAFYLMFAAHEVTFIMKDEYEMFAKVARTMTPPYDPRRVLMQIWNPNVEEDGKTVEDKDRAAEKRKNRNAVRKKQHDPKFEFNLNEALAKRDDNGLGLPPWSSLTKLELVAPFERLGSFAVRQGYRHDAEQFYRNAIYILRASPKHNHNYVEMCRLLQLESAYLALLIDLRRSDIVSNAEIESSLKRNAAIMEVIVHLEQGVLGKQITREDRTDDVADREGVDDAQRSLAELPPRSRARARASEVAMTAAGMSMQRSKAPSNQFLSAMLGESVSEEDVRLCELSSAAYMYNMGVYYEEFASLDQAMSFLRCAYGILSAMGDRENIRDVAEAIRRVQKRLNDTPGQKQGGEQ